MPKDNTLRLPAGISDPGERDQLISLARDFEAAGDKALAWEGENKTEFQYPDPQTQP